MCNCFSWLKLKYSKTPKKVFQFPSSWMKIPKDQIYDGDTCKGIIYHGGKIIKVKVRLYGYDSPEMKPPKNKPQREAIKKKAVLAKEFLQELIGDKIVWADTSHGFDKYGRVLADLYVYSKFTKKSHVNNVMIEKNHGYPYFGGTKN